MTRQKLTVLLMAAAVIPLLAACSAPTAPVEEPVEEAVVVPADFEGSWVLTRTVETTDTTDQAVGDTALRYITFTETECTDDTCEGTVSVGSDPAQLMDYPYTQVGDVISYDIEAADDCIDGSGAVILEAAREYQQHIELTADEKDGDMATSIGGFSVLTFASIPEAESFGCPVTSGSTEYSYDGVRE